MIGGLILGTTSIVLFQLAVLVCVVRAQMTGSIRARTAIIVHVVAMVCALSALLVACSVLLELF